VLPGAGVELEHPAHKKKARMSVGTKRFFMIDLDSLERNNNRQNGRLEFRPNDALRIIKSDCGIARSEPWEAVDFWPGD
jgi:hypothetical protein